MKLVWILLIGLLGWNTSPNPPAKEQTTGKIIITFTNVEVGKGLLRSAIYGKEKFLKNSGIIMDSKYKADSKTMVVEYENVPYGTYAVAAYQDKDENASLSKNWLGMPAEAYGFSKPLVSKFRVPKFEEVSFNLDTPEKRFDIRIDYWIDQ